MYGFETRALNFMRDYLRNRTQRSQLKGLFSDRREVICGILQGSILGPLLFLIYIIDLPNCLEMTRAVARTSIGGVHTHIFMLCPIDFFSN